MLVVAIAALAAPFSFREPLAPLPAVSFVQAGTTDQAEGAQADGAVQAVAGDLDIARALPQDTILYVDAPGLSALADLGLDHPLVEALLDSSLGHAIEGQSPLTLEGAIGFVDAWLGRAVLPTVHSLTANGIGFGLRSDGTVTSYLLHARGDDPDVWRETLDLLLARAAEAGGFDARAVKRPHDVIDGFDTWFLGKDVTVALREGTFLASNDEALVRQAAASISAASSAEPANASLLKRLSTALPQGGDETLLRSWVDLEQLNALDPSATKDLRELARSPAAHFLFGAGLAEIGRGSQSTARLVLGEDDILLEVNGSELAASVGRDLMPAFDAGERFLPAPVAGESARALVYRDIAGLFRDRAELFPVEVLPSFSEAISNLALFFGGADVSEEIFPDLSPWLGLVLREPTFRAGLEPDQPLPGAALIASVREAESLGPKLVGAFQTAIGLVNVSAAQEMQPPLTLSLSLAGESTVTSASYPRPAEGQGVDLRYNLEPACAMVGDTFVLGTHRSLVEEIATQLAAGERVTVEAPGESLDLSGAAVARVVRANAEALAMNAVLNEGKELEQARQDIAGLAALGDLLETLRVRVERPDEAAVRLSLVLELSQ